MIFNAKRKYLFTILPDFVLFLLLFAIIVSIVIFTKFFLFPESKTYTEFVIRTEKMPEEYIYDIHVGDAVYDTLTKREVGKIKSVEAFDDGERIYFIMSLDAKFKPRSEALRTRRLWFKYTEEKY